MSVFRSHGNCSGRAVMVSCLIGCWGLKLLQRWESKLGPGHCVGQALTQASTYCPMVGDAKSNIQEIIGSDSDCPCLLALEPPFSLYKFDQLGFM